MTLVTTTSTTTTHNETQQGEPEDGPPEQATEAAKNQAEQAENTPARRDAGVSDEVWEQLQRDQRAEQEREDEY